MFGVDGCSGWEVVEEGFEDTGEAAVVVAAFVVVAGVLATAAEEGAGAGVEDAVVDAEVEVDGAEGVSVLEGVLNSTGRT